MSNDIKGSKREVAMNAWSPQAIYPFDTSCFKPRISKGSIGHAFAVRIRTENQDQASFCTFTSREVSVLVELALGHLRYPLTDVTPPAITISLFIWLYPDKITNGGLCAIRQSIHQVNFQPIRDSGSAGQPVHVLSTGRGDNPMERCLESMAGGDMKEKGLLIQLSSWLEGGVGELKLCQQPCTRLA
ncbi:hypothetical protein LAZ67_23000137 [Cordylochernes scorpioides]|uniref:Uncharacterized protein n=1 Tax=Cordylochernes scorpioides TaxID=51811 RepID=A0ABY6LRL1_9ARAC|nr:hypothetical protein LAZ67_23000137 [Cordylochernes scorpioides]